MAAEKSIGACTCGILKRCPPQCLPWYFPGILPRSHPPATCFSHRDAGVLPLSQECSGQELTRLQSMTRTSFCFPEASTGTLPLHIPACFLAHSVAWLQKSLYLVLCLTGIKILQSNIAETEALEQCWNLLQAKGLNKTKQNNVIYLVETDFLQSAA